MDTLCKQWNTQTVGKNVQMVMGVNLTALTFQKHDRK
jgi:hypothetical protein